MDKENVKSFLNLPKKIRSRSSSRALQISKNQYNLFDKPQITEDYDKSLQKLTIRPIKVKLRPLVQCPACDEYFRDSDVTYEHLQKKCRLTNKKERKKKLREFLEKIFNRFSNNQKTIKIDCYANIEFLLKFHYTDDIVKSQEIDFESPEIKVSSPIEYCDCDEECDEHCTCNLKNNFIELGEIYECNEKCGCIKKNCNTKIITNGANVSLEIFQTGEKGHGLRARQKIQKGTFIEIYSGVLISKREAIDESKAGNCYLYDLHLDKNTKASYTMNALNKGNIARFVNHSCDPNLMIIYGFVNCLDEYLSRPKIAFFAKKEIQKEEELTVDYRYKKNKRPFGDGFCKCNTNKCRYRD